MAHYNARVAAGDAWAANMLRMTPCDLWPFLRGRTLWLLGDSITQVRYAVPLPWVVRFGPTNMRLHVVARARLRTDHLEKQGWCF